VNGSFNFTIQATDSVGNVGDRAYAMNVGTSSLTINPASLPPGTQGVAYAQGVNATGGTAPYTFAISAGALPAGLSLNTGTGAITGTPTAGGTANFTIRGTDSLGNTGTRPYALTIGTASLTVNPASLPNTSQGLAYAQTISSTGGTGPYTFAVSAGALPAGLALNSATGAITGSPTASGAASFTVRATDSVGNVGARAYTFNVGGSSLTLNPPSLAAASYRTPYNQSMSVVGGTAPFAFTVLSGALPPGLVLNPTTGAITGSPTTEGSFAFTILVTDSLGNFGTRAYALSTQRSNPADDPEVRGLVASQAAAARRFADTQSTNVMRRLEALRDRTERCGFDFGVVPIALDGAAPEALRAGPMVDTTQPMGLPGEMTTRREPVLGCDPHLRGSIVSLWANGSLQLGKLESSGGSVGNKFSTSGVTAGIDAFVTDRVAVGAAIGYGFDETDIGQNGTRSDAYNVNGMAYASYKAFANVFIDIVAGYGALSFDNRRWVELDQSFVSGSRAGSTLFGSAAVTAEFRPGIFKLAPYARLDASATRLDGYAEDSATSQALTFDKTRFQTVAGAVGLRASFDMRGDAGLFTPMLRVEYKRALDGAFTQGMSYSDTLGASYAFDHARSTRHQLMAAIGLRGQLSDAMSFELEYGVSASPDQDAWKWQGHSIRGVARWMF
jgi:uncharacterized protein YhjY with autotransporter beta-barrel domain